MTGFLFLLVSLYFVFPFSSFILKNIYLAYNCPNQTGGRGDPAIRISIPNLCYTHHDCFEFTSQGELIVIIR